MTKLLYLCLGFQHDLHIVSHAPFSASAGTALDAAWVKGATAQQRIQRVTSASQCRWKHTEVGRIVWKALRRKRKAATFKEGQPIKQGAPVSVFNVTCTRTTKRCQV